ncbi:methylenetetrahydrofolate dehydrogenase (NADP+) / methenyltetrahydrofolate cyclohydrolase [Ferrimonas sediminum]|uniref:Bifunctional protein FolD n=1 Tax=Ferrimonas sediminum TaxID=718193 RepID=A0A1G8W2G8_9GAMM|nr:bifunctional methylenetetrahydrofolate dehydrogenase/methenyltetrahydrofolate cyclohydrolase FolD [Ferrimonas sediminum]SDJ72297.1 methylenetetrahydrofolate dehydrogenase (NADP+) / methenyltetrahydrofolate cyclohydrolase [Ferrimonas sediminum]
METAAIINGKEVADSLVASIATQVAQLEAEGKRLPGLAVVMVGDNPASDVYVRNKTRRCQQAGILGQEFRLDEATTEADLLGLVDRLNDDPGVDGILVQLPLPAHLDEQRVLNRIAVAKDVDGFHPNNVGKLSLGDATALVPCTPQGCVTLAQSELGADLSGKHVVIVGRSNIVGKPAAQLFLAQHCSVTVVHSRSANGAELARQADILVVAVGRPEMVGPDWVKPGAVVIDVGINRTERDGKAKLVGDVAFGPVAQLAAAITPVPGGVGPMTIAYLLENTMKAYAMNQGQQV